MNNTLLLAACTSLSLAFPAMASSPAPDVLVYLTSQQLQTQGMAMVLSTQMVRQNANLQLLLCDGAGDLALEQNSSTVLQPLGKSPAELLDNLLQQGVKVEVCALYLPNKGAEVTLKPGITVAKPPQIAEKMLQPGVKVFSF